MRSPAAELATASSSFSTVCAISLICSPSSRPSPEISTACPASSRLRWALSTSLNTVSSKAPDWSEHCTKAKRLPLAEVRSSLSITVPASLMRPAVPRCRSASRSAARVTPSRCRLLSYAASGCDER